MSLAVLRPNPQQSPPGTSFNAYFARDVPASTTVVAKAPLATSVVLADGTLTFDLAPGSYVALAGAAVLRFEVDPLVVAPTLVSFAHGVNGAAPRPVAASVQWVGSVTPANAVDGDTWIDTSF